jgi:hypothetical protein
VSSSVLTVKNEMMKRRVHVSSVMCAIGLIIVTGCNKPATADAPSTASASASAATIPPPPSLTKSGDRLRVRLERGSDGSSRVRESFYDTKFGERCVALCGSDGKQHCLPEGAQVLDGFYADKDCTQRLGVNVKGRPVPPHAALSSKDKLTGAGYACEWDTQFRVFKTEGEYRESYTFLKNEKSGACSKVTEKEDTTLPEFLKHMQPYILSAEVSPSEFVAMTFGYEGEPTSPVALSDAGH